MRESIIYLAGRCFSSIGGIQSLNRQLLALLGGTGYLEQALVRFDQSEDIPNNLQARVSGFGGSARRFIGAALRACLGRGKDKLWLCDHLNYGPMAMILSLGNYVVYTHAYELMLPVSPLKRFALRRAKKVICISDFCAGLVRELGVPAGKMLVLPHGQDFDRVNSNSANSSVPRILFVGRLDRHYKGQDHLLEAAVLLKARGLSFDLRFSGGGDTLESFKAQADRMGIADCVHFLGFVSDAQLKQEFADAAIFAMPSNGEGFGLVYLQAMANGLPCICGDGDAAREVVVNEETGLVVPYAHPEQLADALQRLIESPDLREQMGQAGKARYEAQFTEAAFEERFIGFLGTV
jgi:phosphatidylinositol alpha-1,6-mannosyltransferase